MKCTTPNISNTPHLHSLFIPLSLSIKKDEAWKKMVKSDHLKQKKLHLFFLDVLCFIFSLSNESERKREKECDAQSEMWCMKQILSSNHPLTELISCLHPLSHTLFAIRIVGIEIEKDGFHNTCSLSQLSSWWTIKMMKMWRSMQLENYYWIEWLNLSPYNS